ncbi:MAG: APC family permease [Gulosibacter sp.]|uniref:APC family permease n=1 Tax=Gulosibacter sp. TaxID=2817531 RepID=UPI003F92432F
MTSSPPQGNSTSNPGYASTADASSTALAGAPAATGSTKPAGGPGTETTGLKQNALGTSGIVFFVLSAAAPLSVMAGIAPLGIAVAGNAAPLGYLTAGIVLILFAVGFMAMAKHVRVEGGFYTYITRALGRTTGLVSAVLSVVAYNMIQIGIYGLFAIQLQSFIANMTGFEMHWAIYAVLMIGLVYVLGYRGVDVGAKVLAVIISAEVLILLIVALAVLFQGGAAGIEFSSFAPANLFNPGTLAIMGVCFGAFVGFESTVLYRSEAKNPGRTIPRATYISVIFLGVFYAFVTWTIVLAFGSADVQAMAGENITDLFFIAASEYVGPWSGIVMSVLLLLSLYAMQIAFHNAINRYTFMLAQDGVLPRYFGVAHPKHGSPHRAGAAQSIFAVLVVVGFALAGADPYANLMIWLNAPGVIGIIALQAFVSLAAVVYLLRNRSANTNPWVVPIATVATLLLFGAVYLTLTNMDLMTGATGMLNVVLVLIIPAVFVLGVLYALFLRKFRPAIYERIGTDASAHAL